MTDLIYLYIEEKWDVAYTYWRAKRDLPDNIINFLISLNSEVPSPVATRYFWIHCLIISAES